MFEPRRRRGEFGCEPDGKGSKIAGFEYSLDFLVLFHQGKRTVQHDFMPKNRLFHQKRIKNNVILMRLPWGLGRFTLGFLF
jgi:hypothetical protein